MYSFCKRTLLRPYFYSMSEEEIPLFVTTTTTPSSSSITTQPKAVEVESSSTTTPSITTTTRQEDEEREESSTSNHHDRHLTSNTSSSRRTRCFTGVTTVLLVVGLVATLLLLLLTTPRALRDAQQSDQRHPSSLPNHSNYTAYDIYCAGPILHAVQMHLGRDGKDFVDRPMKAEPNVILQAFHNTFNNNNNNSNDSDIVDVDNAHLLNQFVEDYFAPAGSDLEPVVPPDFQSHPLTLATTAILQKNDTLREWAMTLNALWKVLGRRPIVAAMDYENDEDEDDKNDHDRRHLKKKTFRHSSLLPTRHFLVVAGGRFREAYYWDTYWIVQGLLASDMYETAKGVVQNLLDFVEIYGFVPNGSRIYYLTRSQPPLLSEMVRVLYEHKQNNKPFSNSTMYDDLDFFVSATHTLDKEYQFWMRQGEHAVAVPTKDGKVYILNRYEASKVTQPRPESYREDMATAAAAVAAAPQSSGDTIQEVLFGEITAACESGWDFSSRWFRNHQNLTTAMTSNIIPVDLNAMMHRMEKNMIQFHTIFLNQTSMADMYRSASYKRSLAIQNILWDPQTSMWRDYYLDTGRFSPVMSVSNFFPLWSESLDGDDDDDDATEATNSSSSSATLLRSIQNSLTNSGLLQNGGVLTTTRHTGQQWDDPNAWPPLQDILIQGLLKYPETRPLGQDLIRRWVRTNLMAYQATKFMYEKYNARGNGAGGGGEYAIQEGFGWTNGVILEFLTQHGDLLNDLE